ncbi:hypothetical protein MLD38_027182 [Melastoma candidum]|uniref:Uncharacterized protein n=1 Tax=Melastoma candidum TaxID=119954 RepID=A0ACB9P0P5_9MYRT|nr:hypothetical protein MLD38_027182 [Melastoma candidum]
MIKIPGLYSRVGKEARDLLYKDFARQPPIHFHFGLLDCNCGLHFRIRQVPGFGTDFRATAPYNCKGELQFLHDYVGITSGIGLKANIDSLGGFEPFVSFSGLVGTDLVSLGTDLRFDLFTRAFSSIDAGIRVNTPILIASLTVDDSLDSISGSCYRAVIPVTRTSVAAELKYLFSKGDTWLTLGAQHALFPWTFIKSRINTKGEAAAMIQLGLWKFLFTIVGEVRVGGDYKWTPKVGFSVKLKK